MAKSNRERLSEIVTTLGKYGFGHIYRIYVRTGNQAEDARRFRMAFEELGPSFIKIGQILSTRHDLLPDAYISELQKLQDHARSVPYAAVKEIVESELNASLEELFDYFDEEPLASASIAQVHRARLKSGESVIVKVQRPEIEEELLRDIHLFSQFLSVAPDTMKDMIMNIDAAFDEIETSTARELNFRMEARALNTFRLKTKDSKLVNSPRLHMDYVTTRVLVQEYIEGIPILKSEELIKEGYVLEDIAEKLIFSFMNQIFDYGFYHGDPHPGNLLIKDQQIYFIDFGIVGEVSDSMRELLTEITKAALTENISKLMTLVLQVARTEHQVDQVEFYDDLSYYFKHYSTRSLGSIKIEVVFDQFMEVMHKHKLALPHELITLVRALIILEGVIFDLSPEIDAMTILKSYYQQSDVFNLLALPSKEKLALTTYGMLEKLIKLPDDTSQLVDHLLNGRFVINAKLVDRENRWKDIELMVNRMIYALILASLILASAIIVALSTGGLSIIAIIVFLGAAIVGIWLLISIFKSGMF
ncbi:MAG: lipopolysaccharide core heptose(II) kinase RfaY [Atopococcus tabaci]|uniref:Lipopolysaccharide core heptose(II) kinase RfaY n=1 Tax=Atopococcus tabaci TaxID=269774 RepID=A0AA43RK06_9LACT|nr:lipopolysaccharide core heptose(II) kinase RfaY [Atopococcus tabaci]